MLGFWDQDDENNKNSNNEINNNHNNYCHNPNNNINSQTTLIGCDTIEIILISIVISSKEAIFDEWDNKIRCDWYVVQAAKTKNISLLLNALTRLPVTFYVTDIVRD